MTGHRWSGWPGAWCLDCGCEDPAEIALADGVFEIDEQGMPVVIIAASQYECPDPGSNRHNPYKKR